MKQSLAISLIFAAAVLHAQDFKIGSKVTDFQVQDLDGKSLSFFTLRGPITVVTFIATQCPVSNAYNQRMIALYNDYAPKGVKFIFVNANRTEAASEVRNHAQHAGFPFPVYKDANNIVANHFGAEVTPESYLIDGASVLQYHGSIDDSQNEARIRTRRLRLALDSLLSGTPVDATETKAFGCTIKRVRKST
jgi:thiol-disulfide isomerase/thioredoxin